jgi:NTE family protein
VSKVGLVLGGGGITGASYHFGALFALRLATGWEPNDAEVVVGTSCGAFVAAMIRGDSLSLETLVGDSDTLVEANEWLSGRVYRRGRPQGLVRWLRRGVIPGITSPNLALVLGSPGLYRTDGIEDWVADSVGHLGSSWPSKPTVIAAYDLEARKRVAFGTEGAPDVPLKAAVAASSAVPFVYEPVRLDGRWYVDGGVASGTHADLVLACQDPLDLVIVIAPLAAADTRPGARFYEDLFDRAGRTALANEMRKIRDAWPHTDVLVLRPDDRVLARTRPNPMSIDAAIPSFLVTLRSMRDELAHSPNWEVIKRHLAGDGVAA